MSLVFIIGLLILGFFAGGLSALVGIGGGVILVPALVLIFGLSQQQAQGTTLALLLPPIGIFAVLSYYRNGFIDIRIAILIIIGFLLGSILGARIAIHISAPALARMFGFIMILIGLKFLFFS